MDKSKYSTMRVALIFLAIVSVVLAAIHIMGLVGSEEETPQTDLSGYGTQEDVAGSNDLIITDDGTVEMDSIPNDAMTSGADVSGTDAGGAE